MVCIPQWKDVTTVNLHAPRPESVSRNMDEVNDLLASMYIHTVDLVSTGAAGGSRRAGSVARELAAQSAMSL